MWETVDISTSPYEHTYMCNITFEVPRLSTFVFKKTSEKKIFMIIFVVESLKGFGWNNVGPESQTVAELYFTIEPLYRVIRVVAFHDKSVTRMAVRLSTDNHPILVQCWASVKYD